MKQKIASIGALILIPLWFTSVRAGNLILFTEESPEGKSVSKIYVDRFALRTESTGQDSEEIMIFRRDKNVLWTINNREKTVSEMTPEAMERAMGQMKQSMDSAMKQLQDQLKNLPPEQREMMQKMMGDRLPRAAQPAKPAKSTFRKTASSVKIKRWRADKYEMHTGSEKSEEMWIVRPEALGLGKEETQTVQAFFAFMRKFARMGGSASGETNAALEMMNLPGVPVKSITYEAGKPTDQSEISEVHRQNFPASLFEIPSGLRKVDPFSPR